MPRARNIKPGTFENEDLAELPIAARYLFIALWTLADREGRLEDRPKRIQKYCLTYDDVDVDDLLQMLHESGFIVRYGDCTRQARCKHQSQYIQILTFKEHQSPHVKERASTIPAPDKPGASTRQAPPDSHDSHDSPNPDSKPIGTSGDAPKEKPASKINGYPEEFESIWQQRPKRAGADNKREAFKAYRARLREGHTNEELAAGLKNYRQHVEREGKVGTEFVKRAATFFGPNKHFLDDWGGGKAEGLVEQDRMFRGCK